jgi:hypothetical protein
MSFNSSMIAKIGTKIIFTSSGEAFYYASERKFQKT